MANKIQNLNESQIKNATRGYAVADMDDATAFMRVEEEGQPTRICVMGKEEAATDVLEEFVELMLARVADIQEAIKAGSAIECLDEMMDDDISVRSCIVDVLVDGDSNVYTMNGEYIPVDASYNPPTTTLSVAHVACQSYSLEYVLSNSTEFSESLDLDVDHGYLNCADTVVVAVADDGLVSVVSGAFPVGGQGDPYRFGVFCADASGAVWLVETDMDAASLMVYWAA